MQQFIFDLPYIEPERAFSVFAENLGSIFLDSNDKNSPHAQFSFIGFSPSETISSDGKKTEIRNHDFTLNFREHPMSVAANRIKVWSTDVTKKVKSNLPFTNGYAGYFSYDIPQMHIGFYDQVIAFDLKKKKSFFCVIAEEKNAALAKLEMLQAKLNNFKYHVSNDFRPEWERQKTRTEYKNDIQTAINYIRAGDAFQINLSQRFSADIPEHFNTYAHYLKLRQVNPAPFAAYYKTEKLTLSSSSPERFLKISNGKIETRPIKGTMADTENPDLLRQSEKDRAENIMIVDLMRNDLSKVCEATSIEVPELCKVETYSGLHHLVSSVTGKMKNDMSAFDALTSCFPGGSITGAPKIRAMEIIDELEPSKRGPYCGAIGYIDIGGNIDMNIAIRTLVFLPNSVSLNVGGGIVAESDPEAEYQETMLKARKMFESFETDKAAFDDLVKKTA